MSCRRLLAVLALAGCVLAACGVPAQDEPHSVELPRRALTTPAPGTAATGSGEVAEVLCLVRDGRLVQAVRRVDAPSTAQRQIEHLLAGPTEAERNSGVTTALAGLSLSVELLPGREARVEIGEADDGTARSDEMVAYGQIVCTLTSRADVNAVIFTRDDQRLEVPRADGSLSRAPLRGSDYAILVAPG